MKYSNMFFDKVVLAICCAGSLWAHANNLVPSDAACNADLSGPGLSVILAEAEQLAVQQMAAFVVDEADNDLLEARAQLKDRLGVESAESILERVRPNTTMLTPLRELPGEDIASLMTQFSDSVRDGKPENRVERAATALPGVGKFAGRQVRKVVDSRRPAQTPQQILSGIVTKLTVRRDNAKGTLLSLQADIDQRLLDAQEMEILLAKYSAFATALQHALAEKHYSPERRNIMESELLLPVSRLVTELQTKLSLTYAAYEMIQNQRASTTEACNELVAALRTAAEMMPLFLMASDLDAQTAQIQSDTAAVTTALASMMRLTGSSHERTARTAAGSARSNTSKLDAAVHDFVRSVGAASKILKDLGATELKNVHAAASGRDQQLETLRQRFRQRRQAELMRGGGDSPLQIRQEE